VKSGHEDHPAELRAMMAGVAWDVARVAWEKTGDTTEIGKLLAAGVPAPPPIRDLLLSGLRQERRGRPGKLRRTPEQIVWMIESARLRGFAFKDAEGDWTRSPAFLHVAALLGVSAATVRQAYRAVPRDRRDRIKAGVPADLVSMGADVGDS
jgi:hypothetical protein